MTYTLEIPIEAAHMREAYDLGGSIMSRDDYRTRKAKAKAIRQRRARGTRAKSAQRSMAGGYGPGCY